MEPLPGTGPGSFLPRAGFFVVRRLDRPLVVQRLSRNLTLPRAISSSRPYFCTR